MSATQHCRPIYAGNAIATVRASCPGVRMLSIRTTAFLPAADQLNGGSALVEAVSEVELAAARQAAGAAEWLSEEVAAAERPDLAQARVVIAGTLTFWGKNFFCVSAPRQHPPNPQLPCVTIHPKRQYSPDAHPEVR